MYFLVLTATGKEKVDIAGDADTVDGIHAAAAATANYLLALDASSKLPTSITGDADTVDGIHAATTPMASKLLAMDAAANFPGHAVAGDLILGGALAGGGDDRTLASGVLDASGVGPLVRVRGEGNTHDALTSISNGTNGQILILIARLSTANITVTNGASLRLAGGANFVLRRDSINDSIMLVYSSTDSAWLEVSRSAN